MCSEAAHSFRNGICLLSVMSIFLCFSGMVTGVGGGVGLHLSAQFVLWGKSVVFERKNSIEAGRVCVLH